MRVYVDTNVFGAYPPSALWQELWANTLFARFRTGRHQLVTSALVQSENANAPEQTQALYNELATLAEQHVATKEATELATTYLIARIVTRNHYSDAVHMALATVAKCDVLVTWNARDLVNKEAKYNQVNLADGYGTIEILTPDTFLQHYP